MDPIDTRLERTFAGIHEELALLRSELALRNRRIRQFGWALVCVLVAQLIAALVAFA